MFFLVVRNKGVKNQTPQGYLIINTNKVEYVPGEKVVTEISALDKDGATLCGANLELTVNGEKVGDIKKSSTCENGGATYDPDYLYTFDAPKKGTYKMKLTNLDAGFSISKELVVVAQKDIDVTRLSPVRIIPAKEPRYSIIFSVTANKDYKGEISDVVPAGISIPWQGPATVTENSDGSKKITWQVDLKKGETAEFPYEFTAPLTSPAVYKFGEKGEWSMVAAK